MPAHRRAADGGLELSYTLPREWMPGRLLLRSMLRYTREGVTLARPPDQCLTPVPAAQPGSEVTLWGEGPRGTRLPIDAVARPAGTIGYELMCGLAQRVPVTVV